MSHDAVIRKLLGTPFKYGGRDKHGMDCYGVVLAWWRAHGRSLSDPLRVTETLEGKDCDVFEEHSRDGWEEVSGAFEKGDVVTFSRNDSLLATHCGVYLGGGRVLHATERAGVVVTRMGYLKQRLRKVYRPLCRA